MNDRLRRLGMTAARFALSGALLWLLLSRADTTALMAKAAAIDPGWLSAAFALTLTSGRADLVALGRHHGGPERFHRDGAGAVHQSGRVSWSGAADLDRRGRMAV